MALASRSDRMPTARRQPDREDAVPSGGRRLLRVTAAYPTSWPRRSASRASTSCTRRAAMSRRTLRSTWTCWAPASCSRSRTAASASRWSSFIGAARDPADRPRRGRAPDPRLPRRRPVARRAALAPVAGAATVRWRSRRARSRRTARRPGTGSRSTSWCDRASWTTSRVAATSSRAATSVDRQHQQPAGVDAEVVLGPVALDELLRERLQRDQRGSAPGSRPTGSRAGRAGPSRAPASRARRRACADRPSP